MKRCIQELGFRGVAVGAYLVPEQLQLDAPELRPFWRQVDALDVPVVVHPSTLPQEWAMLRDYDLTRSVGRAYNVTVAVMRVLMSGLLDELPHLRLVMPHLGGTFYALGDRYLASYFDFGHRRGRARTRAAAQGARAAVFRHGAAPLAGRFVAARRGAARGGARAIRQRLPDPGELPGAGRAPVRGGGIRRARAAAGRVGKRPAAIRARLSHGESNRGGPTRDASSTIQRGDGCRAPGG